MRKSETLLRDLRCCDLHCHTCFSDGSNTPEELIELALAAGLSAVALTDHNILTGLQRGLDAAWGRIGFVGGCEFTTQMDGQELHLLGLFLDPDRVAELQLLLDEQLRRKLESNRRTIERLAEAGYPVSYEEFLAVSGEGAKNRVHIARYLMGKGIISSITEGFETLLSPRMGYYRETAKLDFLRLIPVIHAAGGVAVWAHPLFHVDRETCERFAQIAKAQGLDGMEVYYSTYTEDDTAFMQALCEKYGLLESGGSDFHGENKPGLHVGTGYGNLRIPYHCYERLNRLANSRKNIPD